MPNRNARNGHPFTRFGDVRLRNARYKGDQAPIYSTCGCRTCQNLSRVYLHHLDLCGEMLGPMLTTVHNLNLMCEVRASLHDGPSPRSRFGSRHTAHAGYDDGGRRPRVSTPAGEWGPNQTNSESDIPMAVIRSVLKKGLIGYKVSGYETFDGNAAVLGPNDKEWSGLYVAESRNVARGYRTDVVDQVSGNGTAYFQEVHLLEDIPLLACDDARLADGSISETEKATFVRAQIGSLADVGTSLLMPRLGELGYAFKGLHDGTNTEIIIPTKLCNKVVMMKAKTYTYKGFDKKSVIVHIPK